jgi:predicted ATPase
MKIQNNTINKYKAFTKEEKIPIGGSNVFIYGENGSGKSSFYYALKDFFQSSVENVQMAQLRNLTLTDGGTDCSIKVEFDGDIVKTLNETTKNR